MVTILLLVSHVISLMFHSAKYVLTCHAFSGDDMISQSWTFNTNERINVANRRVIAIESSVTVRMNALASIVDQRQRLQLLKSPLSAPQCPNATMIIGCDMLFGNSNLFVIQNTDKLMFCCIGDGDIDVVVGDCMLLPNIAPEFVSRASSTSMNDDYENVLLSQYRGIRHIEWLLTLIDASLFIATQTQVEGLYNERSGPVHSDYGTHYSDDRHPVGYCANRSPMARSCMACMCIPDCGSS
jgi:hypothetical protein